MAVETLDPPYPKISYCR